MSHQVSEAETRRGFSGSDLALIALFAALLAVFAILPPLFTLGAVPFAINMIIVVLSPLVLGSLRAGCAAALYILLGLAGLPIFTGGTSGPARLLGPSGGYLFGFILCGFLAGALATWALKRRPSKTQMPIWLTGVALFGVVVVHICGVLWFMFSPLQMSFNAALVATAAFFPWDCIKAVIAALLAVAIFAAFPRMMPVKAQS